MARLSKERYLVLFIDDSKEDCLRVRLAFEQSERLNFLGDVCDDDILTCVEGCDEPGVKVPWAELLQMDFLLPRRKGVEVLEWLQSQPFKDLVVVLLPASAEAPELSTAYEFSPEEETADGDSVQGTMELLKFLQEYAANRSGEK